MGLSTNQKVPTGRRLQHLSTEHSPVGLWHGDGSLSDSSGNGNTLTTHAGAVRYAPLGGGLRGFLFRADTVLAVAADALHIDGDLTLQCLIKPIALTDTDPGVDYGNLIRMASPYSYVLYMGVGDGFEIQPLYTHEHSGGFTLAVSTGDFKLYDEVGPVLLGLTRISGTVQFYVDGVAFGPATAVPEAVLAGTGGGLYLGGTEAVGGAQFFNGVMGSIKVCATGLTAEQMYSEAEYVGMV